jgi:hypothetical protein
MVCPPHFRTITSPSTEVCLLTNILSQDQRNGTWTGALGDLCSHAFISLFDYFLEESRRIVAAGGFVESGRVNGSLALSRALGDFEFKMNDTLGPDDQIVTGKRSHPWVWACILQYVRKFQR